MKHGTVIINKITAEEGMWLTNGQGVYSKEVYLGKNSTDAEWYEITDEEYAEITEAEYEKILRDQEEQNEADNIA